MSEERPFTKAIWMHSLVSKGHFGVVDITIYTDDSGRQAPDRKDSGVKALCTVTMDLSPIPLCDLSQKLGADDLYYYEIDFMVEWVYHSRSTEFTLIYDGKSSIKSSTKALSLFISHVNSDQHQENVMTL